MEMLRTFIVALFFAGITVCSYYFLNSYPLPWFQEEVESVAGEGRFSVSEKESLSLEPFPSMPSEPTAAEGVALENTQPTLPTLPTLELPESLGISGNQTAAIPAPHELEARNPFEMAPAITVAEPQHHVGNSLPGLSDTVDFPVAEELPGEIPSGSFTAGGEPAFPSAFPNTASSDSGEVSNPLRSGGADLSPLLRPETSSTSSPSVPPIPTDVYDTASSGLPASVPEISTPSSAPATRTEDRAVHEYLMQASSKIQNGEALEVLRSLSPYYGDPRFNQKELEYLVSILVQATTQVVYSQKCFLEPPYVVQNGDTLEGIAQKYQVPVEFIARVNGIQAPYHLVPGQSLKVLRGPFHAIVYLDRYELILTLNGLFAGRFWIGVGGDLLSKDGDFYFRQVLQQNPPQKGFAFEFVPNPAQTTPGQPLGDSLILHPSADAGVMGKNVARGNILLSQTDMSSLQALLGKASKLMLRSQSPHAKVEQAHSPSGIADSSLPQVSNPIASPLEASIGTQASLPGYAAPLPPENAVGIPTSDGLPDFQPGDLPTELPSY